MDRSQLRSFRTELIEYFGSLRNFVATTLEDLEGAVGKSKYMAMLLAKVELANIDGILDRLRNPEKLGKSLDKMGDADFAVFEQLFCQKALRFLSRAEFVLGEHEKAYALANEFIPVPAHLALQNESRLLVQFAKELIQRDGINDLENDSRKTWYGPLFETVIKYIYARSAALGIPRENPSDGTKYKRSAEMATALQDLQIELTDLAKVSPAQMTKASQRAIVEIGDAQNVCIPGNFHSMMTQFRTLDLKPGGGVINRADLMKTLDQVYDDGYDNRAKVALKK